MFLFQMRPPEEVLIDLLLWAIPVLLAFASLLVQLGIYRRLRTPQALPPPPPDMRKKK